MHTRDDAIPVSVAGREALEAVVASIGKAVEWLPVLSSWADHPPRHIGRDASWLSFNERVLAMARDPGVPLLERARFLTIFSSNLDEFFMKRFALLRRRLRSGVEHASADDLTTRQQAELARAAVLHLQERLADCYEHELLPALAAEGIRIVSYRDLPGEDQRRVDAWFAEQVFPILTPLSVDPGHRFPFISNLSENLGVLLQQEGKEGKSFARLKIPDPIPRLIAVPERGAIGTVPDPSNIRFVTQEQVMLHNLDDVFPGLEVAEVMAFRVTRSAGVEAETDEVENLLEHVEEELRQRRFAAPVRIETGPTPSHAMVELLMDELELGPEDVYSRRGLLEYSDLLELLELDRPALKQPRWRPVIPRRLREENVDLFAEIRERDIFVHHPYDSFQGTVERFIAEAAVDPNVLAIKQTLYRTSRDSPFIDSLIHAAESGKAVACLVELRARFDEDKNVHLARQLENHGVHVAYGVVGLKTHCKCSLVVRRESGGLRRYAHLGTGNYHPGTAQLYTDCGLLTCDPEITEDVVNIFNLLTGRSLKREYHRLLVAPTGMRSGYEALIERECEHARAGRPARIVAKMNALEDPQMIAKLEEASQAGVKVILIVRGFCCLRPGVPGVSENITVLSIVGRFLEHSRVYHFANGAEDPADGDWLIGSADWMSRNLNDRVEVAVPVTDREAKKQLHHIIDVNLRDRRRSWKLQPDGRYVLLRPEGEVPEDGPELLGSFETLCREAMATMARESL